MPVLEIAPRKVSRRRHHRQFLEALSWFGVVFLLIIAPLIVAPLVKGGDLVRNDPLRYYAGVMPVVVILAGAAWLYHRRTVLAVNRVAVGVLGLYPPFKPRQHLSKGDWFVPYREIVSMKPVEKRTGFVTAYDVTLKDGLNFQLNALDLLAYANAAEVRRYAKVLAVVNEEISKPQSRAKAAHGEDVTILRERFDEVLRSETPFDGE